MTERAEARIDLAAVARNCSRLVSELSPGTELCAVVKADGYGHGAVEISRAALAAGANRLAVVTAHEATVIRDEFPTARLLTMGALTVDEVDIVLRADSDIALWEEGFRPAVADRARANGRPARVHVKFDSGMGRLGNSDPEATLALVDDCVADPDIELTGFWTHFATADEEGDEFFGEQLRRFSALADRVRSEHPGVTIHAANSAAVLRDPESHFDMARCGIAIYGLDPFGRDPSEHDLEPVLSLHSYVAEVKRFSSGDSAGYGRTWRAPSDAWVGVVPLGYGDGIRRSTSNNGEILVGGQRHPVVGTVSMDNLTVYLGPETDIEPGDPAVLIGTQGEEHIGAEEIAARHGTINYEIACALTSRVPRRIASPAS